MSGNDEYAKQFKVTHYPEFLYSLVRYFDVTRCLETGVWWGVSSRYFLSAGKKNKQNFVLDSIDLPRLDVKNSEKYIGLLVDKPLQENWNLNIGTDRAYLKKLLRRNQYDMYFFDSDKSLKGKLYLFKTVKKYQKNYLIIFDDLEDNLFWYRKELESENKLIIKYKAQFFNKQVDKFIGIIFTENYKNKLEILYE